MANRYQVGIYDCAGEHEVRELTEDEREQVETAHFASVV